MPEINMKQLLEAGAHFGHQTKRWNPKMKKYIFGSRNGTYIIDLQKTLQKFNEAVRFVTDAVAGGEKILFVGTKKQAQEIMEEEARRCGMFYVNRRWLGGTLTNFSTVCKSINRLKELEDMNESGVFKVLPKKEAILLEKETKKLTKFFGGIKMMGGIPNIMFIIDPRKEKIALSEAKRTGVKTVAVVDTNCDPEGIDYVIPSNDDAIRSIKLIASKLADAVLEGQEMLEKRTKAKQEEEAKIAQEKAAAARAERTKAREQKKDDDQNKKDSASPKQAAAETVAEAKEGSKPVTKKDEGVAPAKKTVAQPAKEEVKAGGTDNDN